MIEYLVFVQYLKIGFANRSLLSFAIHKSLLELEFEVKHHSLMQNTAIIFGSKLQK